MSYNVHAGQNNVAISMRIDVVLSRASFSHSLVSRNCKDIKKIQKTKEYTDLSENVIQRAVT
jgi:hypothetical protein